LYFFFFETEEQNNVEILNQLSRSGLSENTVAINALSDIESVRRYNVTSAPSIVVDFGENAPIPYSFHPNLTSERLGKLLRLIVSYSNLFTSYERYSPETREEVNERYRLGLIDPFIDTEETYRIIYNQKELGSSIINLWCFH